jgi:hypothetical protein
LLEKVLTYPTYVKDDGACGQDVQPKEEAIEIFPFESRRHQYFQSKYSQTK